MKITQASKPRADGLEVMFVAELFSKLTKEQRAIVIDLIKALLSN